MLSYDSPHEVEMGSHHAQGRYLIFTDEATVALDIGMKDHGQLMF
jgi:hypothetical protein